MALRSIALRFAVLLLLPSLPRVAAAQPRGEVIVIQGKRQPPAVKPRPRHYFPKRVPPYSDRAIQSDAWTRAWLVLDIDATGTVTRFKFIKRPGYDLEDIAAREAFGLEFEPARDGAGRPISTLIVWGMEWPSYGWLVALSGVATRLPESGTRPVPCRGSGPLWLDSIYPVYRDCSPPDLSAPFDREPWIRRPR
jgi:hypothetical protein